MTPNKIDQESSSTVSISSSHLRVELASRAAKLLAADFKKSDEDYVITEVELDQIGLTRDDFATLLTTVPSSLNLSREMIRSFAMDREANVAFTLNFDLTL